MNRRRIIDAVRDHGALTQVEIADVTRLSPATVSNLVKELDAAGRVDLSPAVRNGRRAVQVSLSSADGLLGAVVFGDRDIRVAIGAGAADILSRTRMPLAAAYAADEELSRATRLLSELVVTSGHSLTKLRAVTVGLPAPIDTVSGQVGADGILPGWRGVPVAADLAEMLGAPVRLENTANLAAVGESRFGALRGVADAVYVKASYGVGAGLIIGGELFRGCAGTAGEIGHVTIDEDGHLCRCGNRGCLDTFVGSEAILSTLRPSHGDLTLRDVIQRSLAGDPGCCRVLGDAGRHLGVALSSVVNLLNPEVIAIGGQLARVGDVVLDPLREAIERRAIPSAVYSVRVMAGAIASDEAEVLGALYLAERLRTDIDRGAARAG